MKKLFAFLMTIAMLATMMTSALAYDAAVLADTSFNHSLTLIKDEVPMLYDITYSFTAEDPEVIDANTNGVINASNAVSGKPVIDSITYKPEHFSDTDKVENMTVAVDWSGVVIKEPGIYRWKINQTFTPTGTPQEPSNGNATFYLFMVVTDNAGVLSATSLLSQSDILGNTKNNTLAETFPVQTLELTITKTVSGSQASKDQYFPFEIKLDAPESVANDEFWLTIDGNNYDLTVEKTAYHAAQSNPTQIKVTHGTTGTFYIWLKHGQDVTISNLPYGTSYTIVEGGNAGYDVSAKVTDSSADNDGVYTADAYKMSDDTLTGNATVAYTNTKDPEVPTGINLQSGAAFAGIALAMGMMVMMFIGKRKEENV